MPRSARFFSAVLCSLFLIGAFTAHVAPTAAADDTKIVEALTKPVDAEFVETPLRDAVEFLATLTRVPISLDLRALEVNAIEPDSPVSRRFQQVPLRSTLAILLRPLHLTYVVDEDEVIVTSHEEAMSRLRVLTVSVEPWVRPRDEDSDLLRQELTDYLLLAGRPEPGWSRDGGAGNVRITQSGTLCVHSTLPVIQEIGELLQALREAHAASAVAPPAFRPRVVSASTVNPRIAKLLDEPIDVEFVKTSCSDVAAFLETRLRLPVLLDQIDENLNNLNVTFRSSGRSLRRTLDRLARESGLQWYVADDALIFSTGDEPTSSTRLYCVADLAPGADREAVRDALEELGEMVREMTGRPEPDWVEHGGTGDILTLSIAKSLVVSTTDAVHREIEELLAGLRRERASQPAAPPPKSSLVTRRYSVVVPNGTEEARRRVQLRKQVAWIRATIAPESWDQNGCRIEIVEDEVIVTHRSDVQRRIRRIWTPFDSAVPNGAGGFF